MGARRPRAGERVIDDASRITPAAGSPLYSTRSRAVYWFAMDRPDAATLPSKNLALDDLPAIVGTETAWAMAAISADAGAPTKPWQSPTRDTP